MKNAEINTNPITCDRTRGQLTEMCLIILIYVTNLRKVGVAEHVLDEMPNQEFVKSGVPYYGFGVLGAGV